MATALSLDAGDNDAGLLLDLLRALAAQAVCIGHALSFFGVGAGFQPPRSPYPQNIGVLVFFVLSGFLIAHVLLRGRQRPGYGLMPFVLDRAARIYSAYGQALLFVFVLDGLVLWSGRDPEATRLEAEVLLGNLLMLQNCVGPLKTLLAVPSYGSAGQFWTLAIEWHLYLCVGGAYFAAAGRGGWQRSTGALLAIAAAPVPLAYFGDAPPAAGLGNGLAILWALGFLGYFLLGAGAGVPVGVLLAGSVLAAGRWLADTVPAHEYRIEGYPLLALAFVLLLAAGLRGRWLGRCVRLQRCIRLAADCSFSLYLLHYSVLAALVGWWRRRRVPCSVCWRPTRWRWPLRGVRSATTARSRPACRRAGSRLRHACSGGWAACRCRCVVHWPCWSRC